MSITSSFFKPVAATLAVAFIAAAQDAPKFTARELFYNAGEEQPSGKPSKPAQKGTTTVTTSAKRQPAPTQTASNPPKPTPPVNNPPANQTTTVAVAKPKTSGVSIGATAPDGSPIIRAADGPPATAPAPKSGPALGVKITLLKRVGNQDTEVDPATEFHAGDKIRFAIQTNGPGYLYIVNQGSSGTWKPIFPSPDVAEGDNHVDGWHSYTMPPKSALVFDEQTGVEKLFIVFSKDPEPEFESMIYSLPGANGKATVPTSPVSQPSTTAPPAKRQKEMLVVASLSLPDSTVSRMRQTYSRDLIIEKMDDSTPVAPGEKKEKAVFVVNPSGSSDPRVVADLSLVHQ